MIQNERVNLVYIVPLLSYTGILGYKLPSIIRTSKKVGIAIALIEVPIFGRGIKYLINDAHEAMIQEISKNKDKTMTLCKLIERDETIVNKEILKNVKELTIDHILFFNEICNRGFNRYRYVNTTQNFYNKILKDHDAIKEQKKNAKKFFRFFEKN
jgi:hypothetical protein